MSRQTAQAVLDGLYSDPHSSDVASYMPADSSETITNFTVRVSGAEDGVAFSPLEAGPVDYSKMIRVQVATLTPTKGGVFVLWPGEAFEERYVIVDKPVRNDNAGLEWSCMCTAYDSRG